MYADIIHLSGMMPLPCRHFRKCRPALFHVRISPQHIRTYAQAYRHMACLN